jgi:ubiquinone/menaquinone biosynthesis C-methylase UbiE
MAAPTSTFLASDADAYDLLMGRWSSRLAPKFLDFAGITSGSLLDVGCGTGSLTAAALDRPGVTHVHGFDVSPTYVAAAKERFSSGRATFEVGDACAMPMPDKAVDHALSLLVLQFVPQAERAIAEMRRVTRPGGTVAAATWDQRGGVVWSRMFWDTAAALDPMASDLRAKAAVRPLALPDGLARAWRKAGLVDVVQDEVAIRMEYRSFDDYWTPLAGKDGPYTQYIHSLTDDARASLREKVRLAYIDGEADGPRSYVSTAWVVKGVVPS